MRSTHGFSRSSQQNGGDSAQKNSREKEKRKKTVKKPLLWADKNSGAEQELRRCELRSWLIIFPKQNTSADKPDRLNQHHEAEAVHVEPDMA